MSRRRFPRALRFDDETFVKKATETTIPAKAQKQLTDLEVLMQYCSMCANENVQNAEQITSRLNAIQSLDLGSHLSWTWSNNFRSLELPHLTFLHLPVYNGSITLPPNIPSSWYRSLTSFAVTVHRKIKEDDEKEDVHAEKEKEDVHAEKEKEDVHAEKEDTCKDVVRFVLPPTVSEFKLYFSHDLFHAIAVSHFVKDPETNRVITPIRIANINGIDFSTLFQSPENIKTLEIGLAGRKPLLEVLEILRIHYNTRQSHSGSLFYKLTGLQSVEKQWLSRLSSLQRIKTNKLTTLDALALLHCIDEKYSKIHGLKEMVIEMVGAESDLLRSPARQSQMLLTYQMLLRRRGYRVYLETDDSLRALLKKSQDTHILHGGRNETYAEKLTRERRERERMRCETLFSTDYGTIDGECDPIESQERLLRRWTPQCLRRDAQSLASQNFRTSDQKSIASFAVTWQRWSKMAKALALYDPNARVSEAMAHVSGVRIVQVDGVKRIVAVWDRDTLFNRMENGLFANDLISNYEYLCGLNLQIDPMSIVNVQRIPFMPSKELVFHKLKDAATQEDKDEMAETKKRAILVAGVCTFGLRVQRPMLSVGCTSPSQSDSMLVKTYSTLLQFVLKK